MNLFPSEEYDSTYNIPFEEYYAKGYRGIIFDIDNTLVGHGVPADDKVKSFFEELRNTGFKTFILTNNKEKRTRPFAEDVKSPYIFRSGKPSVKGYEEAMRIMKTDKSNTLFVGDQIFTDIWGANRAGIHSIFVKQIGPDPEIQIILKRLLEKPVLYYYRK